MNPQDVPDVPVNDSPSGQPQMPQSLSVTIPQQQISTGQRTQRKSVIIVIIAVVALALIVALASSISRVITENRL